MAKRRARRILIAVTTPEKGGHILWWWTALALRLAGAAPVRVRPSHKHDISLYDGLVLCGGADIEPRHYGQEPQTTDSAYDTARDALELALVSQAMQQGKPILGICRGMQMMNIASGGTLYQKAAEVLEDFLPNRSLISKVIGRREVFMQEHSQLFEWMGRHHYYFVNSIHQQAVAQPAEGFHVVAKEENGLVQAMEHQHHKAVIGVQWHPELMLHARSARSLFRHFVEACNEPIYQNDTTSTALQNSNSTDQMR